MLQKVRKTVVHLIEKSQCLALQEEESTVTADAGNLIFCLDMITKSPSLKTLCLGIHFQQE